MRPRLACLVATCLLHGCGTFDECNRSWCAFNNTLRSCSDNEESKGETSESCGTRFCVEPAHDIAFCAIDEEPRAVCEEPLGLRSQACDGLQLVDCDFGYVRRIVDTCDTEEQCIPDLGHCALHPGREPRCEKRNKYCDGSLLVSCELGIALADPVQCASTCVDLDGNPTLNTSVCMP